jgi:hypothetical protein
MEVDAGGVIMVTVIIVNVLLSITWLIVAAVGRGRLEFLIGLGMQGQGGMKGKGIGVQIVIVKDRFYLA